MDKIYCISGMGADHRIFGRLRLPGHELVPVPWLPMGNDDTMASYAHKMGTQIPGVAPIILGLSLGGMLAVELAKQRPEAKVYIVSSAKVPAELPIIRKTPMAEKLIDYIPEQLFGTPNSISLRFIGAQDEDDRKLITDMLVDTPKGFMQQALKMIVGWQSTDFPPGITHLHGTADMVIPPANVRANYWVTGGTHIMVYNKAGEVSKILLSCLAGKQHTTTQSP